MPAFTLDQARGMMLGLAVGDAVGTTVEFKPRGTFDPVTDMIGGGPFSLKPGEWTDDTSMALCLADSLIERGGWKPTDCMNRFVNWREHGLNSVTGTCFDIGNATSEALSRYLASGDPYAGSTDPRSSGNGGIMRLAPAVIACATSPKVARELSILQSRTTHASAECESYASWLADLLHHGDLFRVEGALPRETPEDQIHSSGYVRHTFEAAIWCVTNTTSFEVAVLKAVNLGDDADTVGAVTGQIAGRIYGTEGIPAKWLKRLAWRDRLDEVTDRLYRVNCTSVS